MPTAWFLLGVAVGVGVTGPIAVLLARRVAAKVRRLEQHAQTNERLAEVGSMTSGLAHEIKNPLSTLGLNLQLLQEDLADIADHLDDDEAADKLARVRRRFEMLTRETSRLREILEDFLRYAGRVQLDKQPTDLNRLADELIDFFEPQAREAGVNLRSQLAADPATVSADPTLLKQAVLNLMINATQAMTQARDQQQTHGGADELILRTQRRKHLGRDELRLHIIDTGPGIPDDLRERVFQPYFSQKRGGTGLGLPTARRLVEEHGGSLALHSEPGRGSEFIITLPI